MAPGGHLEGALWAAKVSNPHGDPVVEIYQKPRPAQISPGGSLGGFAIESPFPPGLVRAHFQGFVSIPYVDPEQRPDLVTSVPPDTMNAQRGWVIGPVDYREWTIPAFVGSAEEGLMTMVTQVARTPVPASLPLALRFSANADPGTFTATLNGIDVTDRFGRDERSDVWVAILNLEDAPRAGANTLELHVRATPDRGGPADRDTLVFTVSDRLGLIRDLPFVNQPLKPVPVKKPPSFWTPSASPRRPARADGLLRPSPPNPPAPRVQ